MSKDMEINWGQKEGVLFGLILEGISVGLIFRKDF